MNLPGALAAGAAAVLYGTAYTVTAIALDGFTPIGVAVGRSVIGALLLAGLLVSPILRSHRPATLSAAAAWRLAFLGFVGGGLFILAMNAAVATAGPTVTAFVAGLYAVAAAVLAIPLLGERLEAPTLVALAAALLGTVLLSDLPSGGGSLVGIAIALVAAACFGLYLVLARRWSEPFGLSGAVVGLATLAMAAIVPAGAALLTDDALVLGDPPLHAVAAIGWLAVGPGVAAAVLVVIGMQRLEARLASLFLLLNPPTAAVLGYLLLGERLDPLQLAGAALVLVAIGAGSGSFGRRASPTAPGA